MSCSDDRVCLSMYLMAIFLEAWLLYRALISRDSIFTNMCKKRIRESKFRESSALSIIPCEQ